MNDARPNLLAPGSVLAAARRRAWASGRGGADVRWGVAPGPFDVVSGARVWGWVWSR